MQFVNLYAFDVDFQREIRNGNKIQIFYEVFLDRKHIVRQTGNIKFASLALRKDTYNLYRFTTDDNGKSEYFDSEGKSAVKALMKTPINGAVLSSGYGMRKHPILGYDRIHQGVDFAAPKGTPIMAAGTGFIEKIGMNGGAGNYIRIKHLNGYKTAYGHMSKFASGMKKGTKVTQGQTIGFVGSNMFFKLQIAGLLQTAQLKIQSKACIITHTLRRPWRAPNQFNRNFTDTVNRSQCPRHLPWHFTSNRTAGCRK